MKNRYASLLKSSAVALACAVAITISAHAATKTWDAGVNTTWDTTTANWTGSTFAANDDAVFNATGAGTVTFGENISANSVTFNNAGYTIANGGFVLILTGTSTITANADALIQSDVDGTSGLIKNGTGTLTLQAPAGSAAVLPSGTTTINGGALEINLATAGGDRRHGGNAGISYDINGVGTSLRFYGTSGRQLFNGAQFNFGSSGGGTVSIEQMNPIWRSNTVTTSGGLKNTFTTVGTDLNGQGVYTQPFTLNVVPGTDPSGVDLEFSGNAGNLKMVKNGAGVMTITGSSGNSISGGIDINEGTLEIAGSGRLNAGNYTGGSRNILNNGAFIYSSTAVQTLGGVISGSGTLTKEGSGTLTLSGTNTYTGDTAVNGGTLNVSGTYTGGGTITAADGTTFQVTGGTIGDGANNGDVIIADGGLFSVGLVGTVGGVSTAEIDGTLSLQEGSIYQYTLNSDNDTSDSLTVDTLDLTDTPITISITEIGLTGDGDFADTWTLFTFDGATAPYSVLTEADFNIVSGPGSLIAGTPDIYWDGGTNSLILTGIQAVNIPEPSSLLLLGLGAALLRRRMVRQALRA